MGFTINSYVVLYIEKKIRFGTFSKKKKLCMMEIHCLVDNFVES